MLLLLRRVFPFLRRFIPLSYSLVEKLGRTNVIYLYVDIDTVKEKYGGDILLQVKRFMSTTDYIVVLVPSADGIPIRLVNADRATINWRTGSISIPEWFNPLQAAKGIAHELMHRLIYDSQGIRISLTHKGTSTYNSVKLKTAPQLPETGPIDVFKYYNYDTRLPDGSYYSRLAVAEYDLCKFVCEYNYANN